MSPRKSDPPLFELDELKDLGFDDKDEHDEISVVTAVAIVQDQKTSASNDSKSFLALMRYMGHKFGHHDRRITRLERIVYACSAVIAAGLGALEIYRSLRGGH